MIADVAGARYVIVDSSLFLQKPRGRHESSRGGLFASLAASSSQTVDRFYELYARRDADGVTRDYYLFYPEYFRTMACRLYLYGGRPAAVSRYWVVTFADERGENGARRKRITDLRSFAHYRDAMNAVLRAPAPNRRLVSIDPLETCIPLEPLVGYEAVFASGERDPNSGRSAVQIFRRTQE